MIPIRMITQGLLLNPSLPLERTVSREAVRANFVDLGASEYQVLLEVSTNKFLVNVTKDETGIHAFEIVAVKGFMELTTKMISLLKRLINHLWEMVD